jgi:hypothetical protein
VPNQPADRKAHELVTAGIASPERRLTFEPSPAQRQAIDAPLGPVLVVAGHGARKTY